MDDILKYAVENGIIDLSYVQEKIEMNKREEILNKHPYAIWQGSDMYWNTYLPDKCGGRIRKKKKTKKEIEDIVIEYLKEEELNPTIFDVFCEWNNRRLKLKKISKSTYDRNKRLYNRHFFDFGKKKLKYLSADEFGEFLEEEICRCNLTAKGFSNLKSVSKGFLTRAKKKKIIDWNIVELFDELDVSDNDFKKVIREDYQEVFNESEMQKMIEYLVKKNDIYSIGILLMFLTGIRCGELVALKQEDFEDYSFKIRRTETRYAGEDGKDIYDVKEYPKTAAGIRTCIIPKDYWWMAERIKSLNSNDEYIFSKNGKRMTTNCFRNKLYRICIELGIYNKSPHKARKTYGTILMDNKVDDNMVISLMGHSDISCSEKHYHRNRKAITKKIDILSKIPDFQLNSKCDI